MEEKNKANIFEKFILTIKKKWLTDTLRTWTLGIILVILFIAINYIAKEKLDLPEIDVTENKIYTLSDASKKAIANIKNDIKIYVYGYEEGDSLTNFLKQYNKANNKITYEILTEETNPQKIAENDLKDGYLVLILESETSRKVIDIQNEFVSYDYTTGQQIDIAEQTLTNAILTLNIENKPKIYFLQGHQELTPSNELVNLYSDLATEAYITEEINLINTSNIPDDCKTLLILSPTTDLLESEVKAIEDYINKGGNIIFTQDLLSEKKDFPNLQKILDLYGVEVENGYIVENDIDYAVSDYPYIFMPHVSSTSNITRDIYTDSTLVFVYSSRINVKSEEDLKNLNVSEERLVYSGETSAFIEDLSLNMADAVKSAKPGENTIASIMTKKIKKEDETEVESKLLISANGSFMTDYAVSALDTEKPLYTISSNKDFILNSVSELTNREGTLTIRKDMSSSTYAPTEKQNRIVLSIIFLMPAMFIIIGIVIWNLRKRRK